MSQPLCLTYEKVIQPITMSVITYCVNCNEGHSSSSQECLKFIMVKEIQKIWATKKVYFPKDSVQISDTTSNRFQSQLYSNSEIFQQYYSLSEWQGIRVAMSSIEQSFITTSQYYTNKTMDYMSSVHLNYYRHW